MTRGIDQFRPEAGDRLPIPARRPWRRIVLPLAIVATTGWLLLDSGWSSWRPRPLVRAMPVALRTIEVAESATADTPPDEVVVQAPGWVEAAPDATYVSALTGGVVSEILVLEGDRVATGQPVARLIDDDARIAVERARAARDAARAAVDRAEALAIAAETDLRELVAADRRVAVADAETARLEAVLAAVPARIATLDANRREAVDEHERKSRLVADGAVAEGGVIRLGLRIEGLEAQLDALQREQTAIAAQVAAARAEAVAAHRDRTLLTREKAAAATAAADLDAARAALAGTDADLADAMLRLERCTVVSPTAGVVIERLTTVGTNVAPGPPAHSSHILHLYDPNSLQVRADVPLAEAAGVGVGQAAEIVVDLLPDTVFRGEVVRFVHRADLAKNTVEAKVRIIDPSPLLKPDMLARVRILGAAPAESTTGSDAEPRTRRVTRIFAPVSAVRDDVVWIVSDREDDRGTVSRRPVERGRTTIDGWIEIRDGLAAGDLVLVGSDVLDGAMTDGTPIRFTTETLEGGADA